MSNDAAEPANQRLGWWRRGLLQKTRPFAFTNAAIPMLMPAQTIENSRFQGSSRTTETSTKARCYLLLMLQIHEKLYQDECCYIAIFPIMKTHLALVTRG